MEGKASKLDLGENSYFDVSRLEGCCVSPEESDHTSSDKWFTHGSSQETEGATIESAYIHSIKDLWNKMEITEGDAFAMIDKRTHGLVKLAWLPDIGNEEITTCLVTIKSHVCSLKFTEGHSHFLQLLHSTWTTIMKGHSAGVNKSY